MDEDRLVVQFLDNGRARVRHRLRHALYDGVVDIIIEFDFHNFPHVLTLSNVFVRTAIRQIRDEFDEHFGIYGLRRYIFIIGNTLTATVVDYEVSDYGEREHDDEDNEDDDDNDDEEEEEEDDEEEEEDDENEINENNEVNVRPDPQSRD